MNSHMQIDSTGEEKPTSIEVGFIQRGCNVISLFYIECRAPVFQCTRVFQCI